MQSIEIEHNSVYEFALIHILSRFQAQKHERIIIILF